LRNIYLSKKETVYQIDSLEDIEVVLKGRIRNNGDWTRYYIRLSFIGGDQLMFGECLTFRKASEKVKLD
jgi:hypothetical protein